jgi:HD superfamily phosphohydrolase
VDKIDYFVRDQNRTIGKNPIDIKMIEDARVAKAQCSRPEKCPTCTKRNPRMHFMLCYPLKRAGPIMSFFQKRFDLHSLIYQHKKTASVACMLLDIMCLADPYFRFRSKNGHKFPISRAAYRSDFLVHVKDDFLTLIENSDDERLVEAQALCERISRHDMYKCALDKHLDIDSDSTVVHSDDDDSQCDKFIWDMDEREIQSGMLNEMNFWIEDQDIGLQAKDFIVEKYCMHQGANESNPVDRMRFFDEMNEKLVGPVEDLPVAYPLNNADFKCKQPKAFRKVGIRIYVRDESKKGIANQVFRQWFERMKQTNVGEATITPSHFEFCAQNADEDTNNQYEDDDMHQYSAAVPLSQESLDDEDEDRRAQFANDRSPIPVRKHHYR